MLEASIGYGRYISENELTVLEMLAPGLVVGDAAASAHMIGSSATASFAWPLNDPDFRMFEVVSDKSKCLTRYPRCGRLIVAVCTPWHPPR